MKAKKKNKKSVVIAVLLLIVLAPAVWFFAERLEGNKPVVNMGAPLRTIGISRELSIDVKDDGSGLRDVWVALLKDGKESVLFEKKFETEGLSRRAKTKQENFKISIEPSKLGFSDGQAVLRIRVTDNSWRSFFKGNTRYLENTLAIDTKPPEIEILSRNHNLAQGGTGLVIYKISEPDANSGVYVGKNYFPGKSGYYDDSRVFVSFFALGHRQGPGTEMYVEASDRAGNKSRSGFYHYIGKRNFKRDRINISDRFLDSKMPGFNVDDVGEVPPGNLAKYLVINSKVRQKNSDKIMAPGMDSDGAMYWKGSFLRLPGSATRATFADKRSYFYKGKKIDTQYHLGIDLASVRHAPVPASNDGKVVLVDNIGIYGRTVVIDHGFGLFSTYSHMSRVETSEGRMVKRGEIIGRTGVTGLVGGDHLHYGMYVVNTFVNPREWMDAVWIKNNIVSKLESVRAELELKVAKAKD